MISLTMKAALPVCVAWALLLCAAAAWAKSDADVTLLKTKSVRIEENTITIVAEAVTRFTLIQAEEVEGQTRPWMGRPAVWARAKSDEAMFVIKNPGHAGLEEAWKMSLQAARDLQAGQAAGRIGYYAPDLTIKGSLIVSITGPGYLYPKGQ